MKIKLIISLILSVIAVSPVMANRHHSCVEAGVEDNTGMSSGPSKEERQKWFKEMRELKHRFLIKELGLTKSQQQQFFTLFDAMEDETHKVQREARKMERHVDEMGDDATDLEFEKATEAIYESKQKEVQIETRYKEEFKKVLTPKQLFKLNEAQKKFTRELMDKHMKMKEKK